MCALPLDNLHLPPQGDCVYRRIATKCATMSSNRKELDLSQTNSSSLEDAKFEKLISQIESRLQTHPNNKLLVQRLLSIMDYQSPKISGTNHYSQCQRALNRLFHAGQSGADSNLFLDDYLKWQSVLNAHDLNRDIAISQLYEGSDLQIQEQPTLCENYMKMFKETGAISNVCFNCFKVQILPNSLESLFGLYFILRNLKLERDNCRKCMIELREPFPYPYKGYIFCQSEDEAQECMHRLKAELLKNDLGEMYCGISHGCSEYGLKYPEFKYSADGAHRHFERPANWDELEQNFEGLDPAKQIRVQTHSNSEITVRDMIAFETWIKYAEIIGDETHKRFVGEQPMPGTLHTFSARVRKQAHLRNAQLKKLQERQSS